MNNEKWTLDHFNHAMRSAIEKNANKRFLRTRGDKILFNGFWRQGNKQNVCAWINKATWSDMKTGEGGGVKEFASVAFNQSLPEFMASYGPADSQIVTPIEFKAEEIVECDLDRIFKNLTAKRKEIQDCATLWLETVRGIDNPREKIYSGFENIAPSDAIFFPLGLKSFIASRTVNGHHLVAPLRSPKSEKIENFFFRKLNFKEQFVDPAEKSRLLPGVGGLSTDDNLPLGFGLPHLAPDAGMVVLCEGFVDTLCMEAMLEEYLHITVIGSPSAKFLPKWSQWLADNSKATLCVVCHLDEETNRGRGIGQTSALKALQVYRNSGKEAHLFSWINCCLQLRRLGMTTAFSNIRDVGDSCYNRLLWQIDFDKIQDVFLKIILGGKNND